MSEPTNHGARGAASRNGGRFVRSLLLPIGLAAAAAIAGGGALLYWHFSNRVSTDDAQIEGHLDPVAARVGGTVLEVLATDNQSVKAGAVLVRLDPRDYEAARARANAEFADAAATARAAHSSIPVASAASSSRLTNADSQLAGAQARLASAQARLKEAQANDLRAAQDLQRSTALLQKDEIARRDYDSAVAAAAAAKASVEAAEAGVREAEKAIDSARAGVADARTAPQQLEVVNARAASSDARVDEARAAVRKAELDLEYATIKAPVDGVVTRRSAEIGQVVAAGQPLLSLVSLDDVWVVANFKESQLQKLHPGQRVEIAVDAYGGRIWRGTLESIAAATGARFSLLPPENATGNFVKVVQRVPVKIAVEPGQNPDRPLRPGMSAVPTVFVR